MNSGYLLRVILAFALWGAAVLALLSLVLNGFDLYDLLGAIAAWLLAFWIWPRQRQQQRREQRAQRHQDWSGAVDALELLFLLIEWPIRLVFWLFRRLGDVANALN